jgi:hypothetical protein
MGLCRAIGWQPDYLDLGDVHCLHALFAANRLISHLGAILQKLVLAIRYVRVAHEEFPASIVRMDEALAYGIYKSANVRKAARRSGYCPSG